MKKKHFKLFLLGFFFLTPVFVSIDNLNWALDRNPYIKDTYLLSLPVSFICLFLYFRKYLIESFYSFIFSYTFWITILLVIVDYITNLEINNSMIKSIILLILFIFSVKLSSLYFDNKPFHIERQNVFYSFKYLCLLPSIFQICIILISYKLIGKWTYLNQDIIIYNFHQYLAIAFLPILCFKTNMLFKILIYSFLITLLYLTNNNTAKIICLTYIILSLIPVKYYLSHNYLLFKGLILLFFLLGLFYWVLEFKDYFYEYYNQEGIKSRLKSIKRFFVNLDFITFLFPFTAKHHKIYINWEYHNQFITIYYSLGIFSIYYIGKLINFLIQLLKNDKNFGIMAMLIFCLGSFTINTLLHPYLCIYFGLLVGFLISYFKLTNIKQNVLEEI